MSASRQFPWKTAIIAATIIVLVLVAAGVWFESWRLSSSALERFKTGHITTTFSEDIPTIVSTHGDVLELVTLTSEETFNREDITTYAWGYLPASTTTAEIRVPVTYRYSLRLSDPWRLATRGNVCVVLAPQFRPSLPPAIDTGRMEKRAENGWASFNKGATLDALEKDITHDISKRASDPRHLNLVREQCRRAVAEFVRKWLMDKVQWPGRVNAIIVVFPDEKTFNSDEALMNYSAEPVLKAEQ
ncbi:MAG TPA: hypothetical protein VFY06_14245 [Verrucomicrobiae bacterium]|nr:hypothetical protein [Verrucomicrobiae bacterium]